MLLSQLKAALLKCDSLYDKEIEVTGITSDSRQVREGSLFVALKGYTVDGHDYMNQAAQSGAAAALVEVPNQEVRIPQLIVPDSRRASAILADVYFRHPSMRLKMIGVTGTNGKTTVTHLIEQVLQWNGYKTGLLGTIGKRIGGVTTAVANTTPEAVEVQSILAEMADNACDYGIMEVSSHALELGRVSGTKYRTAVFTNLSQDHLDFHETMDNYRAAKGKLFSRLGNSFADRSDQMSYAVLNADDSTFAYLTQQTVGEYISYGIEQDADVRASNVKVAASGVKFHVNSFAGDTEVQLRLTGRFNVYNALAAMAAALIEGIPLDKVVSALEAIEGIPGRLEPVRGADFTVLVDYSHTPDSLANALATVREFARGRIVTVVGCGGDRDKGKRPKMARVAADFSHMTVLTSDNPRTEDPDAILDDMEQGVQKSDAYIRITDRRKAIEYAIEAARPNDVVLIAGKGHETYQIIGRTKHHFDDREVAREAVSKAQRSL
ncbi:UDP-N-acetylmuramoyl-L-alanyl-D-glutamate--2,6-diaminopimelate ligase [Alicyclobacillus sp. SO9]|uniref:UDP-N-acetylmuramoyl-L-alanyl-D-glutamate--2, 6-diaminopimelate ligase n=1 Tax=Alicyclobacillus sp. SO9 TaxID=2665646 RepID=UPI0018E82D8D|nr:UDP-N-acetylmuramoyl-L-alanyl-D-glutamate--2,6-diaminopimelate ligase [Alicyclobacillus sp. SO9]QQE80701.1 UDP-N-acetylmuramoyl-L-alanyl-D-glutamate--2,6-diaminopimelate ligase [Alicyclobacillus sp. SO9]